MTSIKNIKRKISKIIFIVILILCGFFLLFLGKYAYIDIFKKNSKIELFQNRLSAVVKKMSRLVEFVQKIPQDLVYILEFQDVNNEEIKILLESVLFNNAEICGSAIAYEPYQFDKDSLYYASYIYRKGGTNLFKNLNDTKYNYFNKDWYLIPKTLMKPTWSEPYFDEGGGNIYMSTYSIPFKKFDGFKEEFIGIVTVDVSIEELKNNVQSIGKLWNCYTILLSEKGNILSAPYEDWVYKESIFSLSAKINLPVLREVGNDLQIGMSGIKQIDEFEMKKNWYIFYAPIQINKWGFILLLSSEELNKN